MIIKIIMTKTIRIRITQPKQVVKILFCHLELNEPGPI